MSRPPCTRSFSCGVPLGGCVVQTVHTSSAEGDTNNALTVLCCVRFGTMVLAHCHEWQRVEQWSLLVVDLAVTLGRSAVTAQCRCARGNDSFTTTGGHFNALHSELQLAWIREHPSPVRVNTSCQGPYTVLVWSSHYVSRITLHTRVCNMDQTG